MAVQRNIKQRLEVGDPDNCLMRQVAAGNARAFAALYDRYTGRLLRLGIAVLGSVRDAEDLVHDVFVEVWQKPNAFDPKRGALRFWLQTRARSRAIDRRRALAVRARFQQQAVHIQLTESLDPAKELEGLLTAEGMALLSARQREVVRMLYWDGYTCRQLSNLLDIPIGTIKSRLSAALGILRREFLVAPQGVRRMPRLGKRTP